MTCSMKCRIYPNQKQQILINKTFGCCRFVWNHYLELRQFFYGNGITDDNGHELWTQFHCFTDLVFLKAEYEWLKEPDIFALQSAIDDLTQAYKRFFNGCNTGKRVGYPNFKSKKNQKQSYRTKAVRTNIQVDYGHNRVKLPKLGWIKARLSKQIVGRILNATVSKSASGKYFLSICFTDVNMKPAVKTGRSTGIDLGLKDLAVFSDGTKVNNIRPFEQSAKKLVRAQRRLARKHKGSRRYAKQAEKVALIHEKIRNQRLDWIHKLTIGIVRDYDIIGIEDLTVSNLRKNDKLSKAISDAAWGEIRNQLEYKTVWYGKQLVIADRFFSSSQICHVCGQKNPVVKDLHIRKWDCPFCGTHHDRDVNAAINLELYACNRF